MPRHAARTYLRPRHTTKIAHVSSQADICAIPETPKIPRAARSSPHTRPKATHGGSHTRWWLNHATRPDRGLGGRDARHATPQARPPSCQAAATTPKRSQRGRPAQGEGASHLSSLALIALDGKDTIAKSPIDQIDKRQTTNHKVTYVRPLYLTPLLFFSPFFKNSKAQIIFYQDGTR